MWYYCDQVQYQGGGGGGGNRALYMATMYMYAYILQWAYSMYYTML